MFKEHLRNHVIHSVTELEKLIHENEKRFAKEVEGGDDMVLVEILGHLMVARDRLFIDDIFKSLQSPVELLRTYRQQLPAQFYTELQISIRLRLKLAERRKEASKHDGQSMCLGYGRQILPSWIQELPEKWKNLKKIAFTVKHEVAPLQSNEVSVIRRKCVLLR
ncbi:hypothetical protein Y1Q_0011500 [Alligator mississippiensis]|uniref:Uncharacterized protein n=1 Tax=Alligator mississippiensis TaxID=8496 RepID=A0A151M021_ALLMI|nr:hypothetical protein Y1Q_0011500 [Alligator mississippiensis]